MAELYRFPGHQCEPIPTVFGLGLLRPDTPKVLNRHEQLFRALRIKGEEVVPVGWRGVSTLQEMARRMADVALSKLTEHPYRPVGLAGHSAGAAAALEAANILQQEGEGGRLTGLRLISTSPVFGEAWQNFLIADAPSDKDFNRLRMRHRFTGDPCPSLPHPALITYGASEGPFMQEQAEEIHARLPRSLLLPIFGGTTHRIEKPGHAATQSITANCMSDLSLQNIEDFDSGTATWLQQPGIGIDYAYTGFGSAIVRERVGGDPVAISLRGLYCLMERIYDGETSSIPCEDEPRVRYAMCAPKARGVVLDEEVFRFAYVSALEGQYYV